MPLQSNIAILYAQGKLGQETTLAEDARLIHQLSHHTTFIGHQD